MQNHDQKRREASMQSIHASYGTYLFLELNAKKDWCLVGHVLAGLAELQSFCLSIGNGRSLGTLDSLSACAVVDVINIAVRCIRCC